MSFSSDNKPGVRTALESEEADIFFSGPFGNLAQVNSYGNTPIKSSVTDSGNTPTTTLRAGNLLAKKTSDGLLYAYGANANDGTQDLTLGGVLKRYTDMLEAGAVVDKVPSGGLLRRALLKYDQLLGYDLHALGVLARMGCLFDKDSVGSGGAGFLEQPRSIDFKSTDYTVLTTDNGKFLKATAACNFTLPTLAAAMAGFTVRLMMLGNANMVVTAAADTIVYDDTANGKATTLTWSTASQKMGASVIMQAGYSDTSGTLAWFPLNIQRTVVAA